jgi:hypothetical protein
LQVVASNNGRHLANRISVRVWKSFENITMTTANTVLGKVQNMKYVDGSARNVIVTASKTGHIKECKKEIK